MTVVKFPTACKEASSGDAAARRLTAHHSEIVSFPRLSIRELRRLWGVSTEGLLKVAADGRAVLRDEEFRS